MRKTFIAGAALAAAMAASSVYAADLPVKAQRIAAPVVLAPQWTGFNLGLSLGGRFAKVDGTTLSFGGGPVPFPALANQNYDSSTFRVGGYVGYDWQFDPKWVAGLEADFAWGDGKKRVDALQGIVFLNTGNYSEVRQTWDAGVRARLGYLIDPTLLLYVTGGVQWQRFEATVNCAIDTCNPGGIPAGAPFLQTNGVTRSGGTIGGGLEKMLGDKWLVRGEYRYANYGSWTTTFGGAPLIVKTFNFATHTAFLGIAKKF
jgi:outer membrane immunogenic protein